MTSTHPLYAYTTMLIFLYILIINGRMCITYNTIVILNRCCKSQCNRITSRRFINGQGLVLR